VIVSPVLADVAAPHGAIHGNRTDDTAARLERLEAFESQVSTAFDQLVSAVLELKEQRGDGSQLEALAGKVRELEQQLAIERSCHDLARVSRMHPKTRTVVCVGTTYFGCNVKYAWAELHRQADALGIEPWFLPSTAEHQALVESLGGRCLPFGHAHWSPDHLRVALSAAVVVTSDHLLNPNPFAAALLAGARHIQLWHGVSIKEIGLRNLWTGGRSLGPHLARVLATCGPYARFVGTAAQGEDEWRRWFAFDRYAPTGYPRNDVLYRDPDALDALDLAGTDRPTWERAGATRARGKRVLLYAPTFRDGRPAWLQLEWLQRLAQAAAQRGDLLIVNLHPVEQPQVPKLAEVLPGVAFVAPRTDIYPLLARCSALVTDYSSVMFDYLHLDRPVLWFRPDHETYTSTSRALFDAKLPALPGPLFTDAASLARALQREDLGQTAEHARLRHELRGRWFDHHDGASAQRLLGTVEDELALAGVCRSAAEAA
jgi:CDP-glycerol glycerophosphotransferase